MTWISKLNKSNLINQCKKLEEDINIDDEKESEIPAVKDLDKVNLTKK